MGAQLLARARVGVMPRFGSPDRPVVTVPCWFGPGERPLLGWLSLPAGTGAGTGHAPPEPLAVPSSAVVICPPVGYEYWCAHRSLRELAETLAGRGVAALRFDYDGTADSAGGSWDPDRLGAWRASVRHAGELLRGLGVSSLALAGLRLGASLALLEASAVGAEAVACWAPVASGRRYRRELELLGMRVPDDDERPAARGGIVLAGFGFAAKTLESLNGLDLGRLERAPGDVLVLERPERPAQCGLVAHLEKLGARVEHLVLPGTERVLDVPVEDGEVPGELVGTLAAWLVEHTGTADGPGKALAARATAVRMPWAGGEVIEEVVTLTRAPYAALRTAPAGGGHAATVVFLNSGSEPHVGPGRSWVEYARDLARGGIAALRVDFPGWGETPGPFGRPYDQACCEATIEIVRSLERAGEGHIVLAGLCAGAWVALRAVLDEPVSGVVAINPQLYYREGDPLEALLKDTRVRRAPERRREELGRRTGWWTLCDLIGLRNVEGRWLDDLIAGPTKVLLCFAEGDDGLEYLRNRLARRLTAALASGGFELVEIPDIDHAMHQEWRRPAVAAAIQSFVSGLVTQ